MSLPSTPAEVTDEFLCGRVAEYYSSGFTRSLLEYLGMTPEEYARWFFTGQVPSRVARVWSTRAWPEIHRKEKPS
jgi:hypothetical protein